METAEHPAPRAPRTSPLAGGLRGLPWGTILLWTAPLALALALRAPYFGVPILNEDEGLYAAVARAMQQGGLPYRDAWEHAAPGIYYLYWLLFTLFGAWQMDAVRVAALLAHWGAGVIVGAELRRRRGTAPAVLGALLTVLATGGYLPLDAVAALTEVFLLPPLLGAAVLLLRWAEGGRPRPLAIGALIALAAGFKVHAGLLGVVLLAALWLARVLAGRRPAEPLRALLAVAGAAAGAYLLLLAPIILLGGLPAYLERYLEYNLFYLHAGGGRPDFWPDLWSTAWQWGYPQFLVVALGAAGLIAPGGAGRAPRWLLLAAGFVAALLLALLGGRLFGHYFLPAAAFAGWLAGEGAARLLDRLRGAWGRGLTATKVVAAALLAAGIAHPVLTFHLPGYVMRAAERPELMNPLPRLTRAVQSFTESGEEIWVWGFAPEIYVYTERDCSSRFINCVYLTGLVPWVNIEPHVDTSRWIVPGSWRLLQRDLTTRPPAAIVDTAPANYQHWGKYPISGSPMLHSYLRENYRLLDRYDGMDLWLRNDVAERYDF